MKEEFFQILSNARAEIPALRQALVEGRIDGSCYEGECCCLVGTIAKERGVSYRDLRPNPFSDVEGWFAGIWPGDTPENNEDSAQAVAWIDEFLGRGESA